MHLLPLPRPGRRATAALAAAGGLAATAAVEARHLLRGPPFSTPVQQALIRYAAFGPDATAAQVAFYEHMLIECPADVRAACGVALSEMNLWHALDRLALPTLAWEPAVATGLTGAPV